MNKWHDRSPGPTDSDNRTGHWPGGWLHGEWKCPKCMTTFGRNLLGAIPFDLVSRHKCKPERIIKPVDVLFSKHLGKKGESK